jgi:hypothetical protein
VLRLRIPQQSRYSRVLLSFWPVWRRGGGTRYTYIPRIPNESPWGFVCIWNQAPFAIYSSSLPFALIYTPNCQVTGPCVRDPDCHLAYMYKGVTDAHPAPPLSELQIRFGYLISPDCRQLYIVIVAKPYAWLQELYFWRTCDGPSSAVSWSLSNIVRFPPVRYCQIPSAIEETALYSRFGGHNGGVVRGEKRKRTSSIWFSWPTANLQGNQGDSPGQPKRSLRVATAVRFNYKRD